MELGDSITARTDFRQPLARKLAAAGCTVQSVGSVKLDPTDSANEGHGGLRADQIADGTRAWVAAAKPDIVLVHVGTNDFYQSQDVASTVVDTRRIVSEIQAAAPKAQTYVARIIPGGGIETQTQALGAEVALLDNGSSVHVVDQFSDVRPSTDTVDGAHPTAALGEKMAERWFNAIRPAVASACKA